jgi:hypothetical protein
MFNTIADAVKVLGEARTLRYINRHAENVEYRKNRQARIKKEDAEAKALLTKVRNDPRFADIFKKKVG